MSLTFEIILLSGALLALSILATALSARIGAPLLLVFLGLGVVVGQGDFALPGDEIQFAHLVGNAALAIILFDGGLRTNIGQFRVGLRPALSLATVGVALTAGCVGVTAHYVLGLPWLVAMLMGAIVSSTDAAAVFSLLHTQKLELKQRLAATLEIESGSNDPMAIFLTLALLSLVMGGADNGIGGLGLMFVQQMGEGALFGLAGGWLLLQLLNAVHLTSSALYPLMAMAGGLVLFAACSLLGGSGFLAVYLAGLVLGNGQMQAARDVRRFHDGLAWLAQISMFLVLGMLAEPAELLDIAPGALILAAVLVFAARPIGVLVSLAPFRFSKRERAFVAWVGLRGAVPIVLALFPLLEGLAAAELMLQTTFFVVLFSLVVQGWTLAPVARWLRLDVPNTANRVKRFETDLPGRTDYELAGYELSEASPVVGRSLGQLGLPADVVIGAVERSHQLHNPADVAELQAGDRLFLFLRPHQIDRADATLAAIHLPARLSAERFFGDFVLHAGARLGDLALLYGINVPDDLVELTVAELFARRYGAAVVGDRVRIRPVEFVVRELDGAEISNVGMRIVG